MKFPAPEPLPADVVVDGFTLDPNSGWAVAYAGPCGDADCGEAHMRLYLCPMIGWLHVCLPLEPGTNVDILLRPAIMTTSGSVGDYLEVPPEFKFIAVLRKGDATGAIAREIYRRRFGSDLITEEEVDLPNQMPN